MAIFRWKSIKCESRHLKKKHMLRKTKFSIIQRWEKNTSAIMRCGDIGLNISDALAFIALTYIQKRSRTTQGIRGSNRLTETEPRLERGTRSQVNIANIIPTDCWAIRIHALQLPYQMHGRNADAEKKVRESKVETPTTLNQRKNHKGTKAG